MVSKAHIYNSFLMKKIQPVDIWKDGGVKKASHISVKITHDDLKNLCVFSWSLKSIDEALVDDPETGLQTSIIIDENILTSSSCTMSGSDYQNWNGSNDDAYEFVASQINVVIVNV